MSGFAVLFHRDGSPVDAAALALVSARLAHRGPDGDDTISVGPFGAAHHHLFTTPEEIGERQPLADSRGRLVLALDGRVDNREELAAALAVHESGISDAALLLLGFEKWREGLFARVLGPFALAIYDTAERAVFLARDALGDRTLFLHRSASRLVAASEESAVLAHAAVGRQWNEQRMASLFAIEEPGEGHTFFSEVEELSPARWMRIGATGFASGCSWEPRLGDVRRSEGEWVERFRDTLERSVACRLRTPGRSAVLLSGGLDSPPIAALAARKAPDILAISWRFEKLTACDESAYVDEIVRSLGIQLVTVPGDDAWPLGNFAAWPFNPNTPEDTPFRWLPDRSYVAAREAGTRVVLMGTFGDDLYVDGGRMLLDLLSEGRPLRAFREAVDLARDVGARNVARGWFVSPLVPDGLRRRFRPRRPRSWLTPYALELLPDPLDWPESAARARRPGQARTVLSLGNAHGLTAEIRNASVHGVDNRYPFRDRRLVELMLEAPAYLLRSGRLTRPIVRRAFKGMLPASVLTRTDKTTFGALVARALEEAPGEIYRDLLSRKDAYWRRFVKPEWVAAFPPGTREGLEELVLWHCVSVELWRERMLD